MATKKKEVTETDIDIMNKSYVDHVREKLDGEEKVPMFFPSSDYAGASFVYGNICGVKFKYATDATVNVPKSVAELFGDNKRNRNASAQRFRKEMGQDVEIRRF